MAIITEAGVGLKLPRTVIFVIKEVGKECSGRTETWTIV